MPQSFSRKIISPLPNPRASASAVIFSIALFGGKPRVRPRIHRRAVFRERRVERLRRQRLALARLHDDRDCQAILGRKFKVALVMRGNAHHRARSVFHQNEISHPDRNLFAVKRVHARTARRRILLFPPWQCPPRASAGAAASARFLQSRPGPSRPRRASPAADAPAQESTPTRHKSCRRAS